MPESSVHQSHRPADGAGTSAVPSIVSSGVGALGRGVGQIFLQPQALTGLLIVAGIATIWAGRLDDRFGPRNVIMASLIILVVAGLLVFFLHSAGTVAFWVLGLLLSACVGPAQSAARSFLARLIPEGQEGEIFGLYATTGRAVSFMAPAMYGIFIYLGTRIVGPGANYWGILGIVAVLATGLLLMLRVGNPVAEQESAA